jgi:transcriptional regulator with XRE-family HTH domain
MLQPEQAFGETLRELRMAKGWSQETLAFEAGLDRTYISLLERGQRSPTITTLYSLAAALGLSFPDLAHKIDHHMRRHGRKNH